MHQKLKKGFAAMPLEKRTEVARKGGNARKRSKEERFNIKPRDIESLIYRKVEKLRKQFMEAEDKKFISSLIDLWFDTPVEHRDHIEKRIKAIDSYLSTY